MQIYKKELENIVLPVKQGDNNNHVKKVQEWLNFHKFGCKIDSDFGPATLQQVKEFQKKYTIDGKGVVEALTWGLLIKPLDRVLNTTYIQPSLNSRIVEVAQKHLVELPVEIGGDNKGPWVRQYCKGLDGPAFAWCQGFASSIVEQACVTLGIESPIPLYYEGGQFSLFVPTVVNGAKSVNKFTSKLVDVTLGSFFFVKGGQWGHSHVGIVTENLGNGVFKTIEGNTNDDGSANGYEVCARVRTEASCNFGVM